MIKSLISDVLHWLLFCLYGRSYVPIMMPGFLVRDAQQNADLITKYYRRKHG